MSTMLEPGCSKNQISPTELPDTATSDQPTPWKMRSVGNGHCQVDDANGVEIYHVFCWDEADWNTFARKWLSVNGSPLFLDEEE